MHTAQALIIVGILIMGRTTYALWSGSAANNDRGYTRDGAPIIYWFTIIGGYIVAIGVFVAAFMYRNGS